MGLENFDLEKKSHSRKIWLKIKPQYWSRIFSSQKNLSLVLKNCGLKKVPVSVSKFFVSKKISISQIVK